MTINNRFISEVIIDPHYEIKHSRVVTDEIILRLVKSLAGKTHTPDDYRNGFEYFKSDPLYLDGLNYRLIWLLQDATHRLGVINCHRR